VPRLKSPYQPPAGYLNADAAAAKVGVATRTWWKWRAAKTAPPATWVGGRVVWRETVIDEWLLKREERQPA
jgi:predicted DNA-binding transcriptional regulator AlpA